MGKGVVNKVRLLVKIMRQGYSRPLYVSATDANTLFIKPWGLSNTMTSHKLYQNT